jgi:hypothetical protein
MNIVVIGNSRSKPSFYAELAELPGTRVRYCHTESEAINILRLSRERCAGILLESTTGQRDNLALARTLRTVRADVPILFIRHFQNDRLESAQPASSHCTVERTADGEYRLHCALRDAEWNADANTSACGPQLDSPWMFEFSAPCKVSR